MANKKNQEPTLSARGRNTITQLGAALADLDTPMSFGRYVYGSKPTRYDRRQHALHALGVAKSALRREMRKLHLKSQMTLAVG